MKTIIITTAMAALAVLTLSNCATTSAPVGAEASGTTAKTGVQAYPFDVCLVTDNELGSMGDPVAEIYKGREVKFCCAPCIRKFNANPEKYMARLDSWIAEAGM